MARFPTRDHFAAYNGTAPVEVSSGEKKIYRLSLRGNRRLNHAIHMAAITQIRHKHSDGRAYYERKLAAGKTHKEALRCLKRRISDAIYARLRADARQGAPGRATGEPLCLQGGQLTPRTPALRTSHSRASGQPTIRGTAHAGHPAIRATGEENPAGHLTTTTTKRIRSGAGTGGWWRHP